MTAFLPEFLPDELLYSTIARWRDRMLPRDQKTVLNELFGRPTGIAVVDFPGHLDAFLARLPPRHPHEAEALLDRHTPLPYYAPFVPSDRLDLVRSRLRRGGSGGIPDLLGIRASTVRSPRSLQFCPACAEYDHARFGEPYWHRCHQLPGVWVCHVHRARLWTSGIRRSGGAGRHVFRSLSLALASSTRPLDPPSEGGALWEWIAHETADLLTGGSRQMSGLAVRELYRDRLAELSLMRGRSQVRMTDLRIAFERHFGRQVLEAIGCGVRTASGEDDWLSRLLRKPRTAQHPLQHLLLMHFLGVEPQEQLARARSMPPRGVAGRAAAAIPTCPNLVCPEAGAAKRSARGQMKSPKRVECSACGMIYQSAPAGGGRVRVWVRGHAWEEKLRALVDDAPVSLREIARRLGVTPKAVQGHARRLGVWREAWEASTEPMGGATDQVVLRSRTEAHRAEWLRLQAHHPDEGVKALRVRAPATYAHLYRSDRQWLMEHRPSTRRSARLPRVDWRDRDRQMLAAARIAVQALRAEPGCPPRLTRTAIARRMGHLSLIEQHMDRMPRTRAFLASVVESREAYARRRLRWATEQFRMEGVAPSASQVGRRAGLRPDLATQLAADVDGAVRSLEPTDLLRAS